MRNEIWLPEMAVGNTIMDAAHESMMQAFCRLSNADDETLRAEFTALTSTMESDFCEEENMMEKINFPGLLPHREVHARVLSAMHHAMADLQNGNISAARQTVSVLPDWFILHLSTMDAELASAWNAFRTNAPVVPM